MARIKTSLICCGLICVSVFGNSRNAAGRSNTSATSTQVCFERQKLIEKEIAKRKAFDWVGEYRAFFNNLTIAPESGFFFFRGSDDISYSTCAWGSVEWTNGKLRMIPDVSNTPESVRGMPLELVPVVWGDRRYLIATDRLLDFVNAVNNGYEPRYLNPGFGSGSFYKLAGDVYRKVVGHPNVPVEYREYLLTKPIRAKILSIGNFQIVTEDAGRIQIRITTITINVGRKDGVKEGMNFITYRPSRVHEDAVITNVSEDTSEAVIRQEGVIYTLPSVKWKLSTTTRDIK